MAARLGDDADWPAHERELRSKAEQAWNEEERKQHRGHSRIPA